MEGTGRPRSLRRDRPDAGDVRAASPNAPGDRGRSAPARHRALTVGFHLRACIPPGDQGSRDGHVRWRHRDHRPCGPAFARRGARHARGPGRRDRRRRAGLRERRMRSAMRRLAVQVVGPRAPSADRLALGRCEQSGAAAGSSPPATDGCRAHLPAAARAPRSRRRRRCRRPARSTRRSGRWSSATGDLLMPLKTLGDEATVVENLETIARYRQVLAIENPDPRSRLRGKVSLELLRAGRDGTWSAAEPDDRRRPGRVRGGRRRSAFRITSRHDADVYIALVDFGSTAPATCVELDPTHENEAQAERARSGSRADLPFPDGLSVRRLDRRRCATPRASRRCKLFVTEQPVDFRGLEQAGVRSAAGRRLRSAVLLQDAVPRHRHARRSGAAPVAIDDWTTVSRSFVLRRRTPPCCRERRAGGHRPRHRRRRRRCPAPSATGLDARTAATTRGGLVTDALQRALDAAGVETKQTIEIADARSATRPAAAPTSPPVVELRLRSPPEGYGQMVLAADELGVVSWCFAASRRRHPQCGDGASAGRTYRHPGGRARRRGAPARPALAASSAWSARRSSRSWSSRSSIRCSAR